MPSDGKGKGKDIDNCSEQAEEPASKPVRRGKDMATIMEVVEGKEKAEAVAAGEHDDKLFCYWTLYIKAQKSGAIPYEVFPKENSLNELIPKCIHP